MLWLVLPLFERRGADGLGLISLHRKLVDAAAEADLGDFLPCHVLDLPKVAIESSPPEVEAVGERLGSAIAVPVVTG